MKFNITKFYIYHGCQCITKFSIVNNKKTIKVCDNYEDAIEFVKKLKIIL